MRPLLLLVAIATAYGVGCGRLVEIPFVAYGGVVDLMPGGRSTTTFDMTATDTLTVRARSESLNPSRLLRVWLEDENGNQVLPAFEASGLERTFTAVNAGTYSLIVELSSEASAPERANISYKWAKCGRKHQIRLSAAESVVTRRPSCAT